MKLPRIWPQYAHGEQKKTLSEWFLSPLGQELLSAEQQLLDHILPDLFGYHALQLGQVVPCHLLRESRILHRFVADKQLVSVQGLSALQTLPHQLPLASQSVDVVVIHHLLEVTHNPHALLREAARVVIPEGHILIVGFNPWSLWGLWRFCRMPWTTTGWLTQALSAQRLHDWLSLLGFEMLGVETSYFRPPVTANPLRQHLLWLETLGRRYWPHGGASYVILAQKKSSCLTPIRLRPQIRALMPAGLATESRKEYQQNQTPPVEE